jgi:uncharacterized protein YutE (UPF0331/DUF86 family)
VVDAAVVAAKVGAIRDAVRNLVAHRYGVLDPARVHAMASQELGDLLDFCEVVSREVAAG